MTAGEVALAVIGACVVARMALSLYRIGRGVTAARDEMAIWRRHHPRHGRQRPADETTGAKDSRPG